MSSFEERRAWFEENQRKRERSHRRWANGVVKREVEQRDAILQELKAIHRLLEDVVVGRRPR